jgi:hypothetical protein
MRSAKEPFGGGFEDIAGGTVFGEAGRLLPVDTEGRIFMAAVGAVGILEAVALFKC